MVKLVSPDTSLKVALALREAGLQVFPAKYKDKIPLVKWKQYIEEPAEDSMVDRWFRNRQHLNYWVMTGRNSGYVVIDCDTKEGEEWWSARLDLTQAACVKTSKGHHYWFKIPDDWDPSKKIESWSVHPRKEDGHNISFDLRADDTGVIVPPSVHETGFVYEWVVPLEDAADAPPSLLDGTIRRDAPVATGDAGAGVPGTGGVTRSMLSRLLAQPPGGEGSGRNDWLARVAGHYAKTYHNAEDLFEAHCLAANRMMGDPLDEAEFRKTIDSVWKGEHERNQHRAVDSSCGYLVSGNTQLLCQVVVRRGEDKDYDFVEYADFDLHAKGVMQDEASRRTYWAEIVRKKRDGSGDVERIDVILRAETLGDDRAFRKFLAGYACTIVPPDNMWPKVGSPGIRIQRYLESQRPPVVEISPALGYHAKAVKDGGGYITHDGVITATGLVDLNSSLVRADPRLKAGGTAPHEYGFRDNEVVASQLLAEVLTFHDEHVTSVFGAWWAACLLKPQIEDRTSLFPFMAIEAPSESGKTNGFFEMMTQLNGNTRGETQPTKAALRDMAAAHRNGIVWVDDLDDPAYLMELLRAATSGGSLTKMGEDRESVKNTKIVSPIVISGEALGLGTQKALVDRAIALKAPSPTSRRSLRDPSRPQWDDVLAVRESYPDGLAVMAGWYVQAALGVVDQTIEVLRRGRAGGSGRAADKVAVLRAGACLLDYLTGQESPWDGSGTHATRVEEWLRRGDAVDADGVAVTSNENALTLELLPWALREWKFPDKASAGDAYRPDTPVFIRKAEHDGEEFLFGEDSEVWFHCGLLSQAWEREKRGNHEKRTTTESALKDQAEALDCRSKRIKISQSGGRTAYYRKLTGPVAAAVIQRALGR
jgi:hypothetical protein